jgi:nucleoside-diphosphate-sugar epimerase
MPNPLASDLNHILDHTRDLWDELRGQRIFITGGTGFFGCWLLESFIWANEKLNLKARAIVLTRSPGAFRVKAPHLAGSEAVALLQGDIRTFDFPKESFSHIIHAATESSTKLNDESPLLMLDTIIDGTRRTLDFAKACGARKFLLTSSGAVYGKQPPNMTHISEDYLGAPDPMDPKSAYGQGKRIAEHLCALYANTSLEIKIARCFAFVGPYLPLDIHFAIGNFIRDALNGGPIIVKGDGTPYRSYLYAADLAIWLWTILFKGRSCHPYNVGSAEAVTIAELAHTVARTFTPPLVVQICKASMPGQSIERYVPYNQRVKARLSLEQTIPLAEAIRRSIDWHQSLLHFLKASAC